MAPCFPCMPTDDDEQLVSKCPCPNHATCQSPHPLFDFTHPNQFQEIKPDEDEIAHVIQCLASGNAPALGQFAGPPKHQNMPRFFKPRQAPKPASEEKIRQSAASFASGRTGLPALPEGYVRSLVDSGAEPHAANKSKHFPWAILTPDDSPENNYTAADGSLIKGGGLFEIDFTTVDGHDHGIEFRCPCGFPYFVYRTYRRRWKHNFLSRQRRHDCMQHDWEI